MRTARYQRTFFFFASRPWGDKKRGIQHTRERTPWNRGCDSQEMLAGVEVFA